MSEELWNKIERAAQNLNIKEGNRRQWKHRGKVPAKWHFPLSVAAKQAGVSLTMQELAEVSG